MTLQPTTINAIGIAAGTCIGLLVQYLTKEATLGVAAGGAAAAVVHAVLPDNTKLSADAGTLVTDLVDAPHTVAGELSAIGKDAPTLIADGLPQTAAATAKS